MLKTDFVWFFSGVNISNLLTFAVDIFISFYQAMTGQRLSLIAAHVPQDMPHLSLSFIFRLCLLWHIFLMNFQYFPPDSLIFRGVFVLTAKIACPTFVEHVFVLCFGYFFFTFFFFMWGTNNELHASAEDFQADPLNIKINFFKLIKQPGKKSEIKPNVDLQKRNATKRKWQQQKQKRLNT